MALIRQWREKEAAILVEEARKTLNQGQVVALPTDTFYALAVHPFQEEALARLAALKGRGWQKPFLLLVSGPEILSQVVKEIPETARILLKHFWPGPLTLILPARSGLSRYLTGGHGGVGVRWPRQKVLCRLIAALGHPVTGTSANRAGEPALIRADDVARVFGGEVSLIWDVGPCPGGRPSTVLDLTCRPPRVLRKGAVDLTEIQAIIQDVDPKVMTHG